MIRLKTMPLAIITVATILGGIVIAKSVGYYETTASKDPVKFKTGELAGLPNPADIRGSYTWQDIEKAFGVPAAESAEAFSLPEHRLNVADRVSTLEEIYAGKLPEGTEIGTGAVRLFVSLYTGLPMEIEEGSVLPDAALALLAGRPGVNAEALEMFRLPDSKDAAVASQSVPAQAGAAPVSTPVASPQATPTATASEAGATPTVTNSASSTETVHGTSTGTGTGAAAASSGKTVVGKTTFGDLYEWGLTEAQVEAAIGYKPGPRTQTVRDSAAANGKEFSEFKPALQDLLDKAAR